jgi:mono/diheme cytochrome c family protein
MKRTLLLAVATIILGTPAVATPKLGEFQAERTPEVVYAKTCGYCHGRNVGPIILGRKLQPDAIKFMVRSGPNGMPAFRPTEITDSELLALAKWISKSKKNKAETGK